MERSDFPPDAKRCLEHLVDAIDDALPLPKTRRRDLARSVRDLWTSLTSERSDRPADYLGMPESLSAYARYFLPWNVVRLVPLFAGPRFDLREGSTLLDLGSGPFTVPIALWIARPELRTRKLKVVCVDRVARVLEAGEAILDALSLRSTGQAISWTIETRRDVIGGRRGNRTFPPADLVTAVNVFTETFWQDRRPVREKAVDFAVELDSFRNPGGRILVVEPGEPRSGAFISAIREAFILSGSDPAAPCPHARACPVSGAFRGFDTDNAGIPVSALPPVHRPRHRVKMPWCHFVCDISAAPKRLEKFSEDVGLPKDRLTLCYLLVDPARPESEGPKHPLTPSNHLSVRMVSDAMRIPRLGTGRYACSEIGYSLVTGPAAEEASGRLVEVLTPRSIDRDEKSGAVVLTS